MKYFLFIIIIFFFLTNNFAQTLPSTRAVDWTIAGLRDTTTTNFTIVNMQAEGAVNNGTTANDSILANVLASLSGTGAILEFPSGDFLFNSTINITDNIIIKGQNAENTTFTFDLGGSGHSISITGQTISADTTSITQTVQKDSNFVFVADTSLFSVGDWVQIIQVDTDLVTSTWAYNTVGQILEIKNIYANKIEFNSDLRMNFDSLRSPYIKKIIPVKNIGIECLKIVRVDNTAPQQSSNIYFNNAVNCWVIGIESENCTFSHIQARNSSNICISKSYFHHAFEYGGNGRAYGVVLHSTTNECRVENNIFKHLRHSMLVQSGANGNVFAYNYSIDPNWDSTPSNSAGDIVLHGNYPYSNLFENNICQNIVIDDSHGPNGNYNTFFRNRSEGYGIFFSASNSPNQNFIGNDIPNTTFPYNLVNYTISGTGHFLYGNNDKGTIKPVGTSSLIDTSYAYLIRPNFVPLNQWAKIGTPNTMGAGEIPASTRYNSNNIFINSCGNYVDNKNIEINNNLTLFPNPANTYVQVESKKLEIKDCTIYDIFGSNLTGTKPSTTKPIRFNIKSLPKGIYFIKLQTDNGIIVRKFIKK